MKRSIVEGFEPAACELSNHGGTQYMYGSVNFPCLRLVFRHRKCHNFRWVFIFRFPDSLFFCNYRLNLFYDFLCWQFPTGTRGSILSSWMICFASEFAVSKGGKMPWVLGFLVFDSSFANFINSISSIKTSTNIWSSKGKLTKGASQSYFWLPVGQKWLENVVAGFSRKTYVW